MTRQHQSSSAASDTAQRQRERLLRPLEAPKSLSSEVVDRLAEQIMSGKLPVGAKLQIDDGKTIDLQIQTCENRGCYSNTPVSPEMLTALKSGKQLKVVFQNLNKEVITIPMPLADFAAAYEKIK